jgi:hypothetical protein
MKVKIKDHKKVKTQDRRTVNIDKDDFDTIKAYCDENALNMPKWLAKLAVTTIVAGYKSLNDPYVGPSNMPPITEEIIKTKLTPHK